MRHLDRRNDRQPNGRHCFFYRRRGCVNANVYCRGPRDLEHTARGVTLVGVLFKGHADASSA